MKIFYLELTDEAHNDRKLAISYDYFDSKMIRAKSEEEARELANMGVGDEGRIWEDENFVSCEVIKVSGKKQVLISSFNAG